MGFFWFFCCTPRPQELHQIYSLAIKCQKPHSTHFVDRKPSQRIAAVAAVQAGLQFGDVPVRTCNDNAGPLVLPGGETGFLHPAAKSRTATSQQSCSHVRGKQLTARTGVPAQRVLPEAHQKKKKVARQAPRRGEWLGMAMI